MTKSSSKLELSDGMADGQHRVSAFGGHGPRPG